MKDKIVYARGCFELYHLFPKFPKDVELDDYHRIVAHALECDRCKGSLVSRVEKMSRVARSKPFEKLNPEEIICLSDYREIKKLIG